MRIISGKYGSRKLKTLTGNNTRPTEDRVREAVFGRTGPYFDGGIILDLFAGSGAVSLEAISRGFEFAYMCDISKDAIRVIYENIDSLGVRDQTKVFNSNYRSVLTKLMAQGVRFDMIYLDPPFHHGTEKEALRMILENNLLKDDGIIIVETDRKDEVDCESPYYVEKSAVYGINKVTYIRKEQKDAESSLSGIL
ncbi:MAG: 16S rRNA (guanine(966)-N(2))-methyltransferase RsmD [Erysipelotrichaceae bacterium]|nr:16S rRNA (guanine(966)-N(2))-methyltransferase RsmD [Erysipelotrichaceae bacterium]